MPRRLPRGPDPRIGSLRLISRRRALKLAGAAASAAVLPRAVARPTGRDADVIVIGAGLAGLHAAVSLQDGGLDVLVLEGSERIGGRVYTLDHVPERPEAGGSEVGPGYARVRSMIGRLGGLTLTNWAATIELAFAMFADGRLSSIADWQASDANRFGAGERARLGPMGPFGVPLSYLPRPLPLAELDSWLAKEAAPLDVSYGTYLRSRGASEEALRYAMPWLQTDDLSDVSALWQLRAARFAEAMSGIAGLDRVVQGMSRVPEGMAALLKREVRLGARVTGIRTTKRGAEVQLASGTILRARHVVCTVPLTVLREISFDPALPPLQAEAFRSIPYGTATCIFFAIKEPYWEEDGLPASVWSPDEFGRLFRFNTDAGQYLWMYKTGISGTPFRAMSDVAILEKATAELHAARPSTVGRVEPTAVVNWSASPWTRGHNAHRAPGQIVRFGNVVASPHGRIHFAGEHTSVTMMGMEGAMESGERAALEVLLES
jgi:monoamine oxidase